jgi:ABC-type polysaccharide/polyol phosphate transport system ATPase subunit
MTHAVKFEHVTKRYPRGWSEDAGPRYASLRHDVATVSKKFIGRGPAKSKKGTLALEDLSFQIEEGESFALIGPNGAGKSTALKIVSRISYPTDGKVRIRGRVAALMEVGSGVHPELTGRENVWLYGQILGLRRRDIRRRFDEIVEFAELGHAIDTPVKFFSTGMQLRLGFSIAVHLEPDVFVVDEALAVGDAGFQAKCVERMTKLVAEGHTLLFVSHDLSAVEAVCTRGLFLLDGRERTAGTQKEAIRAYLDWVDESHQARLSQAPAFRSSDRLILERATVHGNDGGERYAFSTGEDLTVRVVFEAPEPLVRPHVSIGITDGRPGSLVLCSMLIDGGAPEVLDGRVSIDCRMRDVPLLPRVYELWCSVRSEHAFGDLFDWQPIGAFRIKSAYDMVGPAAQAHISTDAPVHIDHDWEVSPCQ